jgi:hypothetical protein
VVGCEPVVNGAACSSGSGENATATANAKPAIEIFRIPIVRSNASALRDRNGAHPSMSLGLTEEERAY